MAAERQSDSTEIISLNCFVDGDKPTHVFTIELPLSNNVTNLKARIKEKQFHRLKIVDLSDLILLRVSIAINDLAFTQPPPNAAPLLCNKRIFSLFPDEPSQDDVHIWVKPPLCMSPQCFFRTAFLRLLDAASNLTLNCLLEGDEINQVITVEIEGAKPVSFLRTAIKEQKAPHLDHICSADLILSQVSIPLDDQLKENLKTVELTILMPHIPLSRVFPWVEMGHLHVFARLPCRKI